MVWDLFSRFFTRQKVSPLPEKILHQPVQDKTGILSEELQQIRSLIDSERQRVTDGFLSLDSKLHSHRYSIDTLEYALQNTHRTVEDLKVAGKLVLELQEHDSLVDKRIHDIEHRLKEIESTLNKHILNFTQLNNQHLVNLTQSAGELTVGSPTHENRQHESTKQSELTKRLVNFSRLTRTERAVLLALYELQADVPERGISVKELVDKVYGRKAKHSKMVYLSKLTKEMALKEMIEKRDYGSMTKVHLLSGSIEFCSHLVAQKHE